MMKRTRNETARWRLLRQIQRRRTRSLERQSRSNMRIYTIRKRLVNHRRNAVLFAIHEGRL